MSQTELPTVGTLLGRSATYLSDRGVRSPRLDAEYLLAHVLGLRRLDVYLQWERPLDGDEVGRLRELVRRRGRREPLAYVLGSWGFRGLDLHCDARALVPRPETEQLVSLALEAIAAVGRPAVLDLGTGSGAIALAIAVERNDATVVATDVSPDALALAAENAALTGLGDRVEFRNGDLFAPVAERFDLVCANLPYVAQGDEVDTEVAEHEPAVAVYADGDGRALLGRFADGVAGVVRPGGVVAAETGASQAGWLADRLRTGAFGDVRVERDLAAVERFVLARRR